MRNHQKNLEDQSMHTHTHTHSQTHVCMYVCIYVYACIHVCVYIYTHARTHSMSTHTLCLSLSHACKYVCVCVMHTYTHIIHTCNTHTHLYTCTRKKEQRSFCERSFCFLKDLQHPVIGHLASLRRVDEEDLAAGLEDTVPLLHHL
jgi:hypothetical protein